MSNSISSFTVMKKILNVGEETYEAQAQVRFPHTAEQTLIQCQC